MLRDKAFRAEQRIRVPLAISNGLRLMLLCYNDIVDHRRSAVGDWAPSFWADRMNPKTDKREWPICAIFRFEQQSGISRIGSIPVGHSSRDHAC